VGQAALQRTGMCCPECLSAEITVREYDFGMCRETGYHDAGERFTCHSCGATGDVGDLVGDDTGVRKESMPDEITPERLATRLCHALRLAPRDHAEALAEILRGALADTRAAAVAATKTACLEIAEDEAERCRAIGAT